MKEINILEKITKFILYNTIVIITIFYIAYLFHLYVLKTLGLSYESPLEFLNRGQINPMRELFLGSINGFIFGFIDNVGLWFGIEHLTKFLVKNTTLSAAWGNMYADFLGSTAGTFISVMSVDYFSKLKKTHFISDEVPIWIETVSTVVGNLFGLWFGKKFIYTGEIKL